MRINQLKENNPIRIKLGKPSNNTKQFLDDYYNQTQENPLNTKSRIYNNTKIEIYPIKNTIHISDLQSMKPNSGAGTKTLNFLKSLADKYNIKLTLTAKPYHNNNEYITDLETLAKWYYKNGFELDDDNLTDDINDLEGIEEVYMIYYPK